jgi:2-dehydro-3-deoxyphosphogluconate aldolase/(4S)-4-hydroxy-2-oxoglutarate aldolase
MKQIYDKRLVPAATVEKAEDAIPLAEALLAGGLDIVEITFRTPAAEEAIRRVVTKFPQMLVGAGTVLTEDQLKRAIGAGIKFAVAPGLNTDLVKKSLAANVPFIAGVATPTEIDRGICAGCKLLKFFPADALGGVKTLKAFAGPFSHTGVKFVPTGGINAANAAEYLALPMVAAVGGSWMVAEKLIKEKNWAEITRLAKEALAVTMSSEERGFLAEASEATPLRHGE